MRIKRALLTMMTAATMTATAQETRTANLAGIGPSHLLDTYISHEKYAGTGFTYLYIREHAKAGHRWNSVIEHELDLASTSDRSDNTSMLEGDYNLYWGRYRRWLLMGGRLSLQAGALGNANLGYFYDMSGSNNPAQARLSLSVMPSAIATYGFTLLRQRLSARYELNLPLAGLMFSPNYGQSYYEIFSRGDYDHNIVPTTFVSAPTLRHQLTLDWQVRRQWGLRIGYLGNYQQAQVNSLKQHAYTHRLVIGVVVTK